ncbi:MAG: hypothetical protein JWM82_2205, partial [Myxococcales bacterium]|nr:hypothetical protein [Myxococcales bacterium]
MQIRRTNVAAVFLALSGAIGCGGVSVGGADGGGAGGATVTVGAAGAAGVT